MVRINGAEGSRTPDLLHAMQINNARQEAQEALILSSLREHGAFRNPTQSIGV